MLQQARNELSNLKTQQPSYQSAEKAQIILDKDQDRSDVLISTAFSGRLALLLEHFSDAVRFFQTPGK